ncbi:MAG: hypothetical protein IJ324_09810 [Lachnospiraceae bacterium]|nr:hypothetical protein [Lachnospiraceae bacterium]
MWNTIKNKIYVLIMAGILLLFSFLAWLKPTNDYSQSERRLLADFPELSAEAVLSGDFMEDFETYTLDQFPIRNTFRSIKSLASLYLFQQSGVNDLYIHEGYLTKAEYPLSETMLDFAGDKFWYLYDTYMADTNVNLYFSIIPDKNYYLAPEAGQLSMNYDTLVSSMTEKTAYMEYIDIFSLLKASNYYYTDTHWRQETLLPVAITLAGNMGAQIATSYTVNELESPFYGVYYGQLSLPVTPDTIQYLTSDILDACMVTSYNTGMPVQKEMYDLSKADSKDPYEMFVCGNDALVTIENPNASTDKELIIFRDSFGSSIAPLLATGYRKVTLVDIRYINSGMLGNFIEFDNQDVLFLYSTLVLNASTAFK